MLVDEPEWVNVLRRADRTRRTKLVAELVTRRWLDAANAKRARAFRPIPQLEGLAMILAPHTRRRVRIGL